MPPSTPDLWYTAQRRAWQEHYESIQRDRFQARPRTVTAEYASTDRVSVDGNKVPFENRSNLTVFEGKSIRVRNAGRPAAALYIPADVGDTE